MQINVHRQKQFIKVMANTKYKEYLKQGARSFKQAELVRMHLFISDILDAAHYLLADQINRL